MFAEPIDPLATSAFGLACFALGGASAALLIKTNRRLPARRQALPPLDAHVEALIDEEAVRWAAQRGTPYVAGVAAPYAKLLVRLRGLRGVDW